MAAQSKQITDSKPLNTVVAGAVLGAVGTAVAIALTNKQTRDQMKKQLGNLKQKASDSVDNWVQKGTEIAPELTDSIKNIDLNGETTTRKKGSRSTKSSGEKTST